MKTIKAFTLVELLVVISIIALMLAVLMPALVRVRAQARRIVCANGIKQCVTAAILYATDDGRGRLPKGGVHYTAAAGSDYDFDDAISISFNDFLKMGQYIGTVTKTVNLDQPVWPVDLPKAKIAAGGLIKSGVMKIFCCPELAKINPGRTWPDPITGQKITRSPFSEFLSGTVLIERMGVNYLAGFETEKWPALPSLAKPWKSPSKLSDGGGLVIMTDQVRYVPVAGGWVSGTWAVVAHTNKGYFTKSNFRASDFDIRTMGEGAGTNIGRTDGSIQFEKLNKLDFRQTIQLNGSIPYGDYTCF